MWIAGPARARAAAGRPAALRLDLHLEAGQRVGLFGGSFNPAHEGHAHVAETAQVRLRLDRVLWLVSPQNPLKPAADSAALAERLASARAHARGPTMHVSDAESRLGSAYTLDTVLAFRARFPAVRFVWIMGADNLGAFHLWRGWTQIMRTVPVAVVARPGALLLSRTAPMARRFAAARRPSREAPRLADMAPPAWVYLRAPLNPASSTAIRARLRPPADVVG